MHRNYVEQCQARKESPEKEHMYRKNFNENFNLSFHPPTKDTCDRFDAFKAALLSASEEQKAIIEFQKQKHLAEADQV